MISLILSSIHNISHNRTNPGSLAWSGYKSAGLHRVMNQGSAFPTVLLLLGSEHRAILNPYLYVPIHAQQHRPQGGCQERLCFPSHLTSKASSPWVSTIENAKELPTLSTTGADFQSPDTKGPLATN